MNLQSVQWEGGQYVLKGLNSEAMRYWKRTNALQACMVSIPVFINAVSSAAATQKEVTALINLYTE